jgi:hypothetical protein
MARQMCDTNATGLGYMALVGKHEGRAILTATLGNPSESSLGEDFDSERTMVWKAG